MISALFRLLLSIALAFNGLGYAMASTMQAQAMAASGSKMSHGHERATPCHPHPQAAMAQGGQGDHLAAPESGNPRAPDCCMSGSCVCASAQAAQYAPQAPASPVFPSAQDHGVPPLQLTYATPALQRLIRPPIG
jgi:hypothetical protein